MDQDDLANDKRFLEPVKEIMMKSREAGVNYRSPLGLTHLYAQGITTGRLRGPRTCREPTGRPCTTIAQTGRHRL